jgi:N-acetylneuraminic acid mutarotase
MPRARGAGGVAVYRGKIYYVGGLHDGRAVAWVDAYDPETGTWEQLPDMPRARDHFQAAVVGDRLYAIGGRDVDIDATTPAVDVLDLRRRQWRQGLAPLPTPRGGFAVAVAGEEILVIGGEGGGTAFDTVESYNTRTNTWRELAPMHVARHGISAAVCGGIYVAAGGREQGGGEPTDVQEVFLPDADPLPCS